MTVHINHLPRRWLIRTPQVFDGRWGAYDHIGNEWVSGEALGDGSVSINAIVTDAYT